MHLRLPLLLCAGQVVSITWSPGAPEVRCCRMAISDSLARSVVLQPPRKRREKRNTVGTTPKEGTRDEALPHLHFSSAGLPSPAS